MHDVVNEKTGQR